MSVYTPVSAAEFDAWLARYAVGSLIEIEPIAAGIENTNYFVTTTRGRYVLTLYERLPPAELPFYLSQTVVGLFTLLLSIDIMDSW